MIWNEWKARWQGVLTACIRIGGDNTKLEIKPPATEAEVSAVEKELGTRLPEDFRQVLISFSSSVEFFWFLPDQVGLPEEFSGIFSGNCFWDLNYLVEFEKGRKSWVETCFPNPDDLYDRIWHGKLAFLDVGNGDYLAFDISQDRSSEKAPVVYLSHDDGEGHGCVLGESFTDFMDRWTQLGCVGAEDWQWLPFTNSPAGGIDASGEAARKWRKWFGIDLI